MEVKLAATEAVTNIIRHGYHKANLSGEVHGLIALFPDRIQIDLVDRGQPYQPQEITPLDLDTDDLQEGGFGLHIIRSVMDTMTYKRIADSYNFWRFVRALR
jgi:serine/threonine-protein kinase RsbW